MAEKSTDVLMKLVTAGGQGVQANAKSLLTKDDKLLFDFWAGKFFEIDDFALGLELNDFETTGRANPGAATNAAVPAGKFSSWRDLRKTTADIKALSFPVDMEPFSFTRVIDQASPVLFQNCANSVGFASATVVKRKPTGQTLALQGFLRLDFKDVLIVGISWTGGELQKEKCKFICRGLTVQYRQQNADGSLAAAQPADWEQKMALRSQSS
jgi:type VI protein secretion system component Hcp